MGFVGRHREFSGPDYEKAVYYPEDQNFLLELEPHVAHYELLAQIGSNSTGGLCE